MPENKEQAKQRDDVAGSELHPAREESPRAVKEDHSLKVHGDKYEKLIPKEGKDE